MTNNELIYYTQYNTRMLQYFLQQTLSKLYPILYEHESNGGVLRESDAGGAYRLIEKLEALDKDLTYANERWSLKI